MGAGLRWLGGRVLAKSARGALGMGFAGGEEGDGCGGEKGRSAVEEALGKASDGEGIAEESGVSGNASHGAGVLVVDLSLNDADTVGSVIDGRRNLLADRRLRGKGETKV